MRSDRFWSYYWTFDWTNLFIAFLTKFEITEHLHYFYILCVKFFILGQRWVQLGAFYPFARNHNTDDGIDQDPVSLGPGVVEAAKEALSIRYELLPFLYSLFVKAHLYGHPVITPTFFHAHSGDKIAYGIDTQVNCKNRNNFFSPFLSSRIFGRMENHVANLKQFP